MEMLAQRKCSFRYFINFLTFAWAWNFLGSFFFKQNKLVKVFNIQKKLTKKKLNLFYVFPLSFEMRIIWRP